MTKRVLIFCIFFLIAKSSYAQLVVAASRGNTFYLGIENRFDFAVKDIPMSHVELRTNFGKISKDSEGNLFWRSCDMMPGKLTLSAYNKQTHKLIGEAEFRVVFLHDPRFSLYISEDVNRSGLVARPPTDIDWGGYPCKVKKFDVTLKQNNVVRTIEQQDALFNSETHELVQKLKNKDTVFVNNILIECGCLTPDRGMGPLRFVRKDGRMILVPEE